METILQNQEQQLLIGSAIKQLRIKAGYSQQNFAKLCKMANTTLSDIENNKQYPHNKNLLNICEVLKIDLAWLVIITLTDAKIPLIFKSKFRKMHGELVKLLQDSTEQLNLIN